MNICWNFSHQS